VDRSGHFDHQAANADHAALNVDAVDIADLFSQSLHKERAFIPRAFMAKALSFAIFLNGA
jgi:hypothetical protein